MSSVPESIRAGFDPERLRTDGHRLIDALADQLARWQARDGLVLPWRDPAEARAHWRNVTREDLVADAAGGRLVDDLLRVARASTALANPRCMGHQVAPPAVAGVLGELMSALINNGMAVCEMGPASVPIELEVVDWMCKQLGMPEGAGGVLTSGGSVGNLTALLAMRQARAGFDVWRDGTHAGPPLAVIVSSEAHYSIARAARILGWGDGGAIAVPIDAQHRLRPEGVERALKATDRKVIGIVAAAGSTATGAFDPLDELADVAAKHDLWLHVDAAHGGSAALSARHRRKLHGIERADSIVWDAHKLLMMPALVTGVLYRREAHAYEAFAQQASYLFADTRPEQTWWDLGQRTLECTKRAMGVELWVALRALGEEWFGGVVDRQCALAGELAAKVAAAPDFELAIEPESNIVCYRHVDIPSIELARLDAHNRALRKKAVDDGRFYIVGTQLPRGYFLRSTLMNPLTESRDLDDLLDHLRGLGRP